MNIPFLDLRASYLELQSEIDAAVKRVLKSGGYILGEEVDAFERRRLTGVLAYAPTSASCPPGRCRFRQA